MFIIKKIAESRLLAAFEQNNINSVKQWLIVLSRGKPFEKSDWNYVFASGKHLPEILIDKSNHHWEQWQNYRNKFQASEELNYKAASSSIKKHLLLSQMYTQGLLSFLKSEKEEVVLPKLRWWHRLLIRIDKIKINSSKKLIEKPYDQDKIKQFFKNLTLEGKEKPLVTRLLKSIEYRFFSNEFFPSASNVEKLTQPAKSSLSNDILARVDNIWLKPLAIQQVVDQNQVLQEQIDVKKNEKQQTVDETLLLDLAHDGKVDQVFKKFQDTSKAHNISHTTFNQFQDTATANYTMIRTWLNNLKVAYGDEEPEYIPLLGGRSNRKGYLNITQKAIEILQLAPGLVMGSEKNVRCKDLPLGFFICPQSLPEGAYVATPTYTLSFSEKYREWQIQNKDKIIDFPFRADPFANLQSTHLSDPQKKHIAYLTPQAFLSALIENFSLEEKHVQFIKRHLISENRALNLIIQMMGREFFIAFIEALSALEKHRYQNCFDDKESVHSILQDFMIFLKQVKAGNEFNDDDLKNLNQLTQLTDIELSWFYLASNDETRAFAGSFYNYSYYNGRGYRNKKNYSISFRDLSTRLFYFFNFLKSFDPPLPLPTKAKASVSEFRFNASDRLNDILICLSQVDNPWIQAKLMTDVPKDFPAAQKKLRDGYCIVHEEMIFGDEERTFEDQCAILGGHNLLNYRFLMNKPGEKEDVLKKISYASILSMKEGYQEWAAIRYFKAIFLRYLAINTNAKIFLQGLEKWNDSIPSYSNAHPIESALASLETHWDNLKNFAIQQANQKQDNISPLMPSWHKTLQEENATYLNIFLNSIGSGDEEVHQLKQALAGLRDKEIIHLNMPIQTLTNEIKKAYKERFSQSSKSEEDILEKFSLICACYHHPQSPLRKNKKSMRLEQISIILMNLLYHKRLFQIETGEGKTLIIQLTALTRALSGKKSDILTHNEFLSDQSYYELEPFASLLGVTVAQKTSVPQAIIDADIFYIDAVTAVSNKLIADTSKQINLPGKRTADYAFVDEADNVLIDIHAHTTMQVADGINAEADTDLEVFLMCLNEAMEEFIEHLQQCKLPVLETQEDQRRFIIERIGTTNYYQVACENHSDAAYLDGWIVAAYTRAHPKNGLKNGVHYILEEQKFGDQNEIGYVVRIVHKDTSGRVDRISQWSAGVHQCVAAWEKRNNPKVKIPALTKVVSEGNIVDYLKLYGSVSAFSGTLGSTEVQGLISNIVYNGSDFPPSPILVPRARKELDSQEEVPWPKFIDKDGNLKQKYTRSYHFTRALALDHQTHYQYLLEAIHSAQEQNYSTIVFFETITECEVFSKFLTGKNIDANKIQIWDDTQTETNNAFHPPEETVIRQASNPKIITLTTAAGSRGTNFRKIDIGILATPGLERVTRQKMGRLGRLFDLGITYEIYCAEDLGGMDTVMTEAGNLASPHAENREKQFQNMRLFIQPFENKKQQHDLDSIQQRKIRR